MDRAAFDQLYASAADPYGVRNRWYEMRKRAILLAALPRARYGNAFEPACGIGVLTRELALRCDHVLASDFSEYAVAATYEATRNLPNVQVMQQKVPDQWQRPPGGFDLIVLSELGYFLNARDMAEVAHHCAQTLSPDGTLLACHWTPAFDERRLTTQTVHGMLDVLGLRRVAHYDDADFRLAVWERGGLSVAQRDGIRVASASAPQERATP
ncbi:MAG TPA: class I SAM-dependent methyltransferase [Variovorax sp.]|nr:class I SAM-dependent methyltransferase [Variovorax sp.]